MALQFSKRESVMKNIKCRGIVRRLLTVVICAAMVLMLMSSLLAVNAGAAEQSKYKNVRLIVGGVPFGVKFSTDGVTVVGFSDLDGISSTQNPAYLAGLRPKDIIISVNGNEVKRCEDLTRIVEESGGKEISLTYLRGGNENETRLKPIYSQSEGKYKTGVWVRDHGAGIGTVTYIIPESGEFGGLGHGICDGETGELVRISSGVIMNVKINSVKKGISGEPGEIKGSFGLEKLGQLKSNTECGVYGKFDKMPENLGKAIPIGLRGEIKCGEATVVTTLADGDREEYKIEIASINKDAKGSKCFVIKITDERLLEKSGGIVQGMSGSPIIQNGKLVGAVTHVMINDPTVGYGIFIENMLNAAQMPMQRAA